MNFKIKRRRSLALVFCVAYMLEFLLYYFAFLVFETDSETIAYLLYALELSLRFIAPVISAAFLLPAVSEMGFWRAILYGAPLSLPPTIYNLPYYYLYAGSYGNDWQDSITIAIPVCLLEIVRFILLVALLTFVSRIFALLDTKKAILSALPPKQRESLTREEKGRISKLSDATLSKTLSERGIFDFSIPYVKGIFTAAFLQFVIYILLEIYEMISHFSTYGNFRSEEITYIIVKLVGIFAVLFISHTLGYLTVTRLYGVKDEDD